jgi:uncharacterized protein YndB with AHSA1/START domain
MTPVKEVTFERTYEAPVEDIWQAWTNPTMLKEWWGPDNVTIPECEVDLRVGGKFYIVMEAGEAMGPLKGTRWPMDGTYTVIEANSKLSYTSKAWTEGQDGMDIDQRAELTLIDDGGKTKLTLKVTLDKVGPNAGMAVEGMKWGFNQQFDKLSQFLEK